VAVQRTVEAVCPHVERVLFVVGLPDTGKTSLLRYMMVDPRFGTDGVVPPPRTRKDPKYPTCDGLQSSGARTAIIGHFSTALNATIVVVKTTLSATVTTLFATELQSSASNHII